MRSKPSRYALGDNERAAERLGRIHHLSAMEDQVHTFGDGISDTLEQIADGLQNLVQPSGASENRPFIEWGIRQVSLERIG